MFPFNLVWDFSISDERGTKENERVWRTWNVRWVSTFPMTPWEWHGWWIIRWDRVVWGWRRWWVGRRRGLCNVCCWWIWKRCHYRIKRVREGRVGIINQCWHVLATCWGREKGCSRLCSPSSMADDKPRTLRGSKGMWEGASRTLSFMLFGPLFPSRFCNLAGLRLPDKYQHIRRRQKTIRNIRDCTTLSWVLPA